MARRIKKNPNELRVGNIVRLLCLLVLFAAIGSHYKPIKWNKSERSFEKKSENEEPLALIYLAPDLSNPDLDLQTLDWAAQTLEKLVSETKIFREYGNICLKIEDGVNTDKFFVVGDNTEKVSCKRENNWKELYKKDENSPFTVWVQPAKL